MEIIGHLYMNETGHWEIVDGNVDKKHEITSGDVIEVLVADKHWIRTRIESANGQYYPVVLGLKLYFGQPARRL